MDLKNDESEIQSELRFQNIIPWPVSLLSPGTMGWYAFIPMMECYHATCSFNHSIDGFFIINGLKADFTGGKGYLEKDWGKSMPSSWVWLQTNHFADPDISLFGSIANIPWLGKSFPGFLFGLYYQNKIYQFATYTGAKITRLDIHEDKIHVDITDKKFRLEISADRTKGIDLPAPKLGEMTAKVNESLESKIAIRFYQINKSKTQLLYEGTGRNAGLEFVGNIEELVKGIRVNNKTIF